MTDQTQALLKQIVANTTPPTTMTISVTIASILQLDKYQNKVVGGLSANNSLVCVWKTKTDETGTQVPGWNIVGIPTGSYQIEQINDAFQRRIKSITGRESKIAITVHEPS